MITRTPTHPVYARIEDEYQRDTQAELQADAYFERYLCAMLPDESSAEPPTLSDEIVDALRDLFIAGWDAARDEQNR